MGYLLVLLSAVAYAGGIVAQTVAARRTVMKAGLDVGIVGRLVQDRVYLLGFGLQVLGFALAFFARADLPLYFVQAGATTSVGLAAVLGAVLLGWRIRPAEIGTLVVLAVGLVFLAGAAEHSTALDVSVGMGLGLVGVLAAVAGAAVLAARVTGPPGAVALGVLAGIAFAVLAIASRPLAAGPYLTIPLEPLFWLMVAAAVIGQSLLAAALQRGTTTATMASMDATGVVFASVAGLLVLGDLIVAGRELWVVGGLALVVSGVVVMALVSRGHAGPDALTQPTKKEEVVAP